RRRQSKSTLFPYTTLFRSRIEFGEIKLNTEFQRKEGLWKDEQQSRLIESILIRFPLPVFYFDGSNPDEWLVIDGLQRLTSLKRLDRKSTRLNSSHVKISYA